MFLFSLWANAPKNRYRNVLPQDAARVTLRDVDLDEEGADYINASYVDSSFKEQCYIAAQVIIYLQPELAIN